MRKIHAHYCVGVHRHMHGGTQAGHATGGAHRREIRKCVKNECWAKNPGNPNTNVQMALFRGSAEFAFPSKRQITSESI